MRNAKITRQMRLRRLRETPVARKTLQKKNKQIASLRGSLLHSNMHGEYLLGEVMNLRARLVRRKEIKLPVSTLNEIMAAFIDDLAKELTRKVLSSGKLEAWTHLTGRAAQMMLQEAYSSHHATFCLEDSFTMFVEEKMEDGDLDFAFKVQNISNHKVLPKHARKAMVMSRPDEKMFFLDDAPPYPIREGAYSDIPYRPVDIF